MSPTARILLALVIGLIAGIFVSVSESPILAKLPPAIEPLGTLWVNAIRMTVVPLIMSLLITAILGSHGGGLLAKLGSKTIALFAGMIAAVTAYTAVFAPPLIALLPVDEQSAAAVRSMSGADSVTLAELPPFRDWLVSLVPANAFKAAADGAILPLLVFTILFGIAATKISESGRDLIYRFFTAIRDIMFVLIEWIMFVAPIGVFGLVFPLAATMGLSAAGAIAYFLAVAAGLITVSLLLLYPLATIVGRVSLRDFAAACAPPQAVGFSTRSSLAALPAQYEAATRLKLSATATGMVLPLAISLFKFATPIGRAAGTFFVARLYGVDLGLTETLLIAASIGLLSFYSPAIPSGALVVMTPVYLMFGLPVQGIGILIALDLIVDAFITMTNVTANVTAATLLTRGDRQ